MTNTQEMTQFMDLLRSTRPWLKLTQIVGWVGALFLGILGILYTLHFEGTWTSGGRMGGMFALFLAGVTLVLVHFLGKYSQALSRLIQLQQPVYLKEVLLQQKNILRFVSGLTMGAVLFIAILLFATMSLYLISYH